MNNELLVVGSISFNYRQDIDWYPQVPIVDSIKGWVTGEYPTGYANKMERNQQVPEGPIDCANSLKDLTLGRLLEGPDTGPTPGRTWHWADSSKNSPDWKVPEGLPRRSPLPEDSYEGVQLQDGVPIWKTRRLVGS